MWKSDTEWSRISCPDTIKCRYVNTNITRASTMQDKQTHTLKIAWCWNWPVLQLESLLLSCRVNTLIDANNLQSRPANSSCPTWADPSRDMTTNRVGSVLLSAPPRPLLPPTRAPFIPPSQGKKSLVWWWLFIIFNCRKREGEGWLTSGFGHHPALCSWANYTQWPGQKCHGWTWKNETSTLSVDNWNAFPGRLESYQILRKKKILKLCPMVPYYSLTHRAVDTMPGKHPWLDHFIH